VFCELDANFFHLFRGLKKGGQVLLSVRRRVLEDILDPFRCEGGLFINTLAQVVNGALASRKKIKVHTTHRFICSELFIFLF